MEKKNQWNTGYWIVALLLLLSLQSYWQTAKTVEPVPYSEFEKALAFCGTGMGIHVAASKCPHVHAAVAESVRSAKRAAAANGCNLLAMGGFWTAPRLGMAMADAFLNTSLGDGYEDWDGFYEYHKIGLDECEEFDYEAYKANGFQVVNPREAKLGPEPEALAF